MRVETIPVPLVDGGGTSLGAVRHHEEGFAINAESFNIVWFADCENVNTLELNEFVGGSVTLIDV